MKTFLVYFISNILFSPFYFFLIVAGATGIMLTKGDTGGTLYFFFYSAVPNLFIFIFIHFLARRWNLSKKLNILFFLICMFILFYFTVIDLIGFANILSH
jgi:hypothetical protein